MASDPAAAALADAVLAAASGERVLSIEDNRLIDHEAPPTGQPSRPDRVLLHYRTPTEPGSPVFDAQDWRVVALHHAGAAFMRRLNGKPATYAANEGIWITSIRAAVEATLAGPKRGRKEPQG